MAGLAERARRVLFVLLRVPFRLLPIGPARRAQLRRLYTRPGAWWYRPSGRAVLATDTASGHPRRPVDRNDMRAVGWRDACGPADAVEGANATLVAFYLPQFHRIAENDAWWGKGFTEWRNVTRALPQFQGHAQPRLPADLGFYDLRNGEVMREQAALARAHGIGAFCFYTYWFGGTVLLDAPVEAWRNDASIDMPWCLCWANEDWSRRWDGRSGETLIAQAHSEHDDVAFIAHVADHLRDPRYLRVGGRPLLLVYRPELLPDARATAQRWRDWCREHGVGEIALACVQSFDRSPPSTFGFDFAVEFPPNTHEPRDITGDQRLNNPQYSGQALDWRELAAAWMQRGPAAPWLFPAVNCGWDNEPRRPGAGRSWLHASPRRYRRWLSHTLTHRVGARPRDERLVFINAWNEWAEGAVLEPDQSLGHAWLQATRSALWPDPPRTRPLQVVVHAWYADVFGEILDTLVSLPVPFELTVTTTADRRAGIDAQLAARAMPAHVHVHPNHGRDILPFLEVADALLDDGDALVLKLHTKRSPHRDDGDAWRRDLVASLTQPDALRAAMTALGTEAGGVGLVGPRGHMHSAIDHMGGNADALAYLRIRLGLDGQPPDTFVAGSMFLARLDALAPLLDAHLGRWEFEPEGGQLDGTMAHAIERILPHVVQSAGLQTIESPAPDVRRAP